jgi:phosphatidyl-myo-inositol dimannoside synthase
MRNVPNSVPPDTRSVLILTPCADGADGISELTRQVARALETGGARDLDVWAIDGSAPSSLQPGTRFWSARGGRARLVGRALRRAARSCDGLAVIVLHVHLAPLARMLAARGAHVTLFLVGIEVWTPLRPRERSAVARADRLVAISAFTLREFQHANPSLARLSAAICPPGIGAAPAPRDMGHGSGFALIVGRLSAAERYKGHDALIDAWPAVREAVPGARLLIAGEGDDRARLERAVADRGLGGAVVFLGRIDDHALASLYERCGFLVMPSAREGFGLVYLEAMRAGKPCIAAHGAADEIITDGVDGVLIEGGDSGRVAAAVVRLFCDEPARTRMGAAAKRRVNERFTERQFGRRLLAALREEAAPMVTIA